MKSIISFSNAGSCQPTGIYREAVIVIGILIVFFLINFYTSSLYPIPWADEVMSLDPAANLYYGNGLRSTAYPFESRDSIHTYAPLYSIFLAGWLCLFGLSIESVRSFHYFGVSIATFILWLAVLRFRLIQSARYRMFMIVIILLGYGISFIYRSGRIDSIILVIIAASFLVITVKKSRTRLLLLWLLSILYPLAGYQLVLFSGIISILLLIYLGEKFISETSIIWFGMVSSLVFFSLLQQSMEVFDDVLKAIALSTSTGLIGVFFGDNQFSHRNIIPKDPSLVFLYASMIIIILSEIKSKKFQRRSITSFMAAVAIFIPFGFLLVAKFPTYYSYLVYLPLSMGVCIILSRSILFNSVNSIITVLLILACITGLPLQLMSAYYDADDRDHGRLEALIGREVNADDWVLCDFSAYYATKNRVKMVFLPTYVDIMSDDDKNSLTALIIPPGRKKSLEEKIGGSWQSVGLTVKPKQKTILEWLSGKSIDVGLISKKYNIQIYRRLE